MSHKLIKFDRSCRLLNVPHCDSCLTVLSHLTLIDDTRSIIDAKDRFETGVKSVKVLDGVSLAAVKKHITECGKCEGIAVTRTESDEL